MFFFSEINFGIPVGNGEQDGDRRFVYLLVDPPSPSLPSQESQE